MHFSNLPKKRITHLFIDISKLSCMCICEAQNGNVTADFIKYYNETFVKRKE